MCHSCVCPTVTMMYAGVSFIASVSFACVSHRHHDVREMATEQQPRSTRVSSWSMCVLQCVCQSSSIHVCSHGACRCMGVSFIERKASDKRATAAAKATEPQPRGCQELGGRPGKARYWGPDHVDKHKHTHTHKRKYTYTHTHTHTYTRTRTEPFHSSSFTSPPSVLVTAIRPCHCHSSLSPPVVDQSSLSLPFVLVTACR